MSVDVTIVLPVYNEAGHLADEVKRIHASMDPSDYCVRDSGRERWID